MAEKQDSEIEFAAQAELAYNSHNGNGLPNENGSIERG